MRELKFRAWDNKRKEWYGSSNPYSAKFYGFHLWGECTLLCPPDIQDLANIEVEQFTGLLDRNGKEIYEGDIVRLKSKRHGEHFAVIKYTAPCFVMDGNRSIFHDYALNVGEIVGNVHQNPELLKCTEY